MMATVRKHHDRTVRLHYGPAHGRIITLTDAAVSDGYWLIPVCRPSMEWKWTTDFKDFADTSFAFVTYQRKRLVTYDDVDDAFDVYDYWVAEGASLPKIGRIQ